MARKRILDAAVSAAREAEPTAADQDERAASSSPQLNPFTQREGALADIAAGRVKDVRLRMVDPQTCRMWEKHNRIYDLLDAKNCADLIGSIRAQGKQEIPAVVRRLENDPDGYDYEVISGARRHFAVSWLREEENRKEIFYLVEVRDLADEEAFRFADLENRGRKDISDFERGREYLKALHDYYGGKMTKMAERMEVSKALLSSYLSIAQLPREVLDAYGDPREIAVRHGQQLSPLLKGDSRDALLSRAKEIAAAQEKAFALGGSYLMGGADVFKSLKNAGQTKKRREVHEGEEGRLPFLTARVEKDMLHLDIDLSARPSPEALSGAVLRAYARLSKRR